MSLNYHRQAIALRPDEIELLQGLGFCLSALSKTYQAIATVKKALDIADSFLRSPHDRRDPLFFERGRLDSLFQLAGLHYDEGDVNKAIEYMERCLVDGKAYYLEGKGERDNRDSDLDRLILSRASLLCVRWSLDDDDPVRARRFASEMPQQPAQFRSAAQELVDSYPDDMILDQDSDDMIQDQDSEDISSDQD
ncbi:hypothetical protein F5Y16DRAFT_255925 [Xylariaceae sp. FL0255]|nr:hypothetical protein F5Y16DRAFT_255925 [Xylariaceae sp. FL0255]